MLVKIFVKRNRKGEPINVNLEYNDWLFEGDEVYKKDTFESLCETLGYGEPDNKILSGRKLVVKKATEIVADFDVLFSIMGYEIVNDSGVVVEKYVSPLEE